MARSGPNRRTGRPRPEGSGQDDLLEGSRGEGPDAAGPDRAVECLGLTFEDDDARRTHFLGRLKAGLEDLHARLGGVPWTGVDDAVARMAAVEHWPMGGEARLRDLAERMRRADSSKDLLQRWKDEVGFPYGATEDILALSDPPWHTACPNPFLGAFVTAHGRPYDPDRPYRRRPFAVDVTEGKTHAVYRAHGYHTKVPHLAIVPSILHYTEPGDLVLDGFAGSGMTGVAAQWCETAPESVRKALEARRDRDDPGRPGWGPRRTILNDLSPLAGFIAANYVRPAEVRAFAEAARRLLDEVEAELGWMYETRHTDGERRGRIDYTVWSEVFHCPECTAEVVFVEEALDRATGRVRDRFPCPGCGAELCKEKRRARGSSAGRTSGHPLERVFVSEVDGATGRVWRHVAFRPVSIRYRVDDETFEKKPDADDRERIRRIAELPFPEEVPTNRLPIDDMYHGSRLAPKGIDRVHHFFLPRAAHALAALWRRANAHPDARIRRMLLWFVEQAIATMSVLNRYRANQGSQSNQVLGGVYYIPSQIAEISPWYRLKGKIDRLLSTLKKTDWRTNTTIVSTASCGNISLPDDSVDYVFTDPPFGENIYYADLNFLVESWHRVLTNATPEAIVDRPKRKGLPEYQSLMQRAFEEYRRVLKPGRWITVVFHNSRNAVWTAIQEAMLAAGFVVADVRTMDKRQGSYRQVTSTAVKQDLVISAYKPNDGLERRFALGRGTEEGAWDFLRTHLAQLPVAVIRESRVEIVAERQPHLLFDRMVAFHVLRGVTVPLSMGDFLAGLGQRFPERDGMAFLPDQTAEYDRRRLAAGEVAQLDLFVVDESSAIEWLRRELRAKPRSFQDIHPHFMREIAGWRGHEEMPELSDLLDENFLHYDGTGAVPGQIHGYLSSNFKELRNLPKDHWMLQEKARDRWYVPDPNRAADVEKRRARILLREFDGYRRSAQKLKVFRMEAVRAGFFRAYQERDYATIVAVAQRIPASVLQEDQKLVLWYDQALTRMEAGTNAG